MKKEIRKKGNHLAKIIWKRMLAMTLSILMVTSVIDYSGFSNVSAQTLTQDSTKIIKDFAALSKDISNQQIAVGASETDIYLPDTLNVTVQPYVQEGAKTDANSTEELEDNDIQEIEVQNNEVEQQKTLENITWKIKAMENDVDTFDSTSAGAVYIYEPVLPEGYSITEGISMPQIKVEIIEKEENNGTFQESQTIDGIEITVKAEKDVFPEGAVLHAEKVTSAEDKEKIQSAVSEEVKAEDVAKTVTKLVSFDITITDAEGNELQPDISKGEVKVSFAQLPMVTEDTVPTQELKVFHMDDSLSEAKGLDTTMDKVAETLEASAEHFSVYTVAQLTDEIRANVEAEIKTTDGTLTYYDTVEEAIIAAMGMSGCTVTLLKDVQTENAVNISSGTFTFDLNGKAWTNNFSVGSGVLQLIGTSGNTASLTVKDSVGGGSITTTASGVYSIFGYQYYSLTLEGGVYTGIWADGNQIGNVLADGYAYQNSDSGAWITDMSDNQIFNVTVAEPPSEMLSASVTEADGTVHNYITIEKAIIAAMGMSGCTVTLLKDVQTENAVNISSGTFTFDLNGKAWTNNFSVGSGVLQLIGTSGNTASLTVKDSVGGGSITTTASGVYSIFGYQYYSLTLEGGVYTGIWAYANQTGNVLADGYAYKSSESGAWITDMSGSAISNVTVAKAPAEFFAVEVKDKDGGAQYYNDMAKAITAAMTLEDCTLKLQKDLTWADDVRITSGKFTLDLNGHHLALGEDYYNVYIGDTANVTFKDSGTGGKISNSAKNFPTVYIGTGAVARFYGGSYENQNVEGKAIHNANTGGTVGALLAEGFIYRSLSDNSPISDTSVKELGGVKVVPAPVQITKQPEDIVVQPDYSELPKFALAATKTGTEDFTCQWYSVGTGAGGADELLDSANLVMLAIETGKPAGQYKYYCELSCADYKIKTRTATLFVMAGTGQAELVYEDGTAYKYPTLETAVAAAKDKPNSTVKLLEDISTAEQVEVSSGTFTIDLNGKIWTSNTSVNALSLKNGCHVTLMDSDTGGKLTTSTAQMTINVQHADLTIKSGIYENEKDNLMSWVLGAYSSGTVTIEGGTIQTSKNIMYLVYLQSVDVVISGGIFSGGNTTFDSCDSVALSGGEYKSIGTVNKSIVTSLLASGYGYKNVSNSTWVNRLANATTYANDLAHYFLQDPVSVEPVPVQITDQPQNVTSTTYGYTEVPTMSVAAEKTTAAPMDSTVSYQWYRVKSGSETSDTALGTTATLTLPTGLDAGTHSFYCAVTCDGYIVNSESATFTVEKATPTITLDVIGYEVYGDEPIIYGNLMYFTATITGINGDYPDGTVTFMDGNNVLFADVAYSTDVHHYQKGSDDVPAGTHSFTAVYTPSTDGTGKNYVGVTSSAVEQTIDKADQSISITEVSGKKYNDADFTLETSGGSGAGAVTFSVPEGNGVLSISQKEDGRFDAAIIGAGEVTVTATKAADTNYNQATVTQSITIEQADTSFAFQSSYTGHYFYTGSPISNPAEADLSITGASYSDVIFEWLDGNGDSLSGPPTTPGDYILTALVKKTANTKQSFQTKPVTISSFDGTVTFAYNGSTTMATWYSADVPITADGYTVSDSVNGTFADSYLLSGEGEVSKMLYFKQNGTGYITDGKTITVNIDKTAPAFSADTDGITISNNNWKGFLNQITFGHFFKENKDVSISATDSGSGGNKYYYYIDTGSTTAKTAEELKSISFTEGSSFSITEENKYIIYAYAVDQAGNKSAYICTGGIVIDKTAPSIMMYEPGICDFKDTWAVVNTGINEIGTVTYIIKTAEVSEIIAQTIFDDPDKKTVSRDGNFPYMNLRFDDLIANTTYYIYGVGTDRAGNNSEVKSTSFTTTTTQPIFADNPTITGTYGQQVKDMTVFQEASTNGVAGSWSVSSTDKPSVGTTATYDVVFTPDNVVQYATVTVQVTPIVNPKSLTETGVTIGEVTGTYTYDGSAKEPTVTVTDSTATITASDCEYSYSNNISAGTATVTVTAKGNYTGTVSRTFTIAKATAPSITWPNASSITYGQKLSKSALSVSSTEYGTFAWTDGGMVPTVGNHDYEATFTPSVDTVANYKEILNTTETVAITITKATPEVTINADISGDAGSRKAILTATVAHVGDGETPTGMLRLIDSTNGSDVDLAGAAEVSITDGKAIYTWTGLVDQIYKVKAVYSGSDNYNTATSTELSFDTTKQNQEDLTLEDIGTKTYGDAAFALTTTGGSGSGTVTFTSTDPKIVSVSGNVATIHKAGTVTITATKATDNTYLEAITSVVLSVEKKELTVRAQTVIAGITDQKYTGKSMEQKGLSVQVNGKTLTKDIDYTLAYENNTNIGIATLTITGKGNYTGTIEKNFQINIRKGATYTVNNMSYKITNAKTNGKGSVALVKSTKSKSKLKGTLKIGDTVTIGGKSFQITAVGAKAFKGYTKLTTVTIGNNVTTIEKEAFAGCSKVTTVTIGTGLKLIADNAFYKCKKLKTLTVNSKNLKTVGKNAIKSIYSKTTIKVPYTKVTAYKKLLKSSTGFKSNMSVKIQLTIRKGATYTVHNIKYKITNANTTGKGTVSVIGSSKSKSQLKGTLKIGDIVKIEGKSFKITAMDAKAFQGYTKLTTVTIGNNVKTIGKEVFSGCSKVTTVTIGTGLKTISTNVFYKCKKLKTITISSKKLKTVGKNAIKSIYSKAAIKVMLRNLFHSRNTKEELEDSYRCILV